MMMGNERCEWLIFVVIYFTFFIRPCFGGSCKGKREILTDPNGTITDNVEPKDKNSKYLDYSRCEWLIDAGSRKKSVFLEFEYMQTECSYDFIFIFDGDSYNSTLLASVSGCTLPQPIIARSGYMLIYFFTDRNYNLKGFTAKYEIQDCPANCHGYGHCFDNKCVCDAGYTGEDCQFQICSNHCLMGECVHTSKERRCICDENYTGVECDLPIRGQEGKSHWYTLSQPIGKFKARTGHVMVFNAEEECIYTFGGFTLSDILDDLMRFCIKTNDWEQLRKSEPWPSGRQDHAAVDFGTGFYLFGGLLENGTHCNELWFFNYTSRTWTIKADNSSVKPSGLTGHTVTKVNSWIYVIGGKINNGLFSSVIYRYDTNSSEESWEMVPLSGGRAVQRHLVGHSAVYHEDSKSIIIYGGYSALQARFAKLSGSIYLFNIETRFWAKVYYRDYSKPLYHHAFHTAVIMGNYMVVYGGNVHIHNNIEVCYDPQIHLYHLGCHQWIKHPRIHSGDHKDYETITIGDQSCSASFYLETEVEKGRFGHAAAAGYGNILFISGGYSGYVRGDLIAYKFPGVVAAPESEKGKDKDYCMNYKKMDDCVQDPECLWCPYNNKQSAGCLHRSRTELCKRPQDIVMLSCSGICGALRTCQSCLIFGQGITMTAESPSRRFYQDKCLWCVKNSTCQRRHAPEGSCAKPEGTESDVVGWWNGSSSRWTEVDQCTQNDIPAGIQMIKYYNPADFNQPDEVKILMSTRKLDVWQSEIIQYNIDKKGDVVIVFKGYIHPLNAQPVYGTDRLEMSVFSSFLRYSFRLSNDSSIENSEEVAKRTKVNKETSMQREKTTAHRNGSVPLFPHTERGYKYYFNLTAYKRMKDDHNASIKLVWNIDTQTRYNGGNTDLTMEYLEQFHVGDCKRYSNCLLCMTDFDCGWCPATGTCDLRGDNSSACIGSKVDKYLITMPSDCVLCEDHVDCDSCTQNELCEWYVGREKCTRRYRFINTKKSPETCPTPCFKRKTCGSCIDTENECFWCENTQTCFPFAHYISRFIHGQCHAWVDHEGSDKSNCRDCSQEPNCSSCLKKYGCGWCGSNYNPVIGKCVQGDFSGPSGGVCSALVNEVHNVTGAVDWSYQTCPDVNECLLGMDNCHDNATCINFMGGFRCKCKRGYEGDGFGFCNKTCFHECDHGTCSKHPDYQCRCDLGYTGDSCNISCGCNNLSTCSKGVGICDECQLNTMGDHCEKCLPGYYGDPSYMFGCQKCECNGHGNESLGFCNGTGYCYCKDNTIGPQCDDCAPKYYGNALNGGRCYRGCGNPTILKSSSGYLGSFQGSGVSSWHAYCVWIISPFTKNLMPAVGDTQFETPTINVTIEDIDATCGSDYVYVYDGIPSFIDGNAKAPKNLLGVFCGTKSGQFVLAKSQIVTIYFETDISIRGRRIPGFNASYHVNDCPVDCPTNKICVGNECQCESGQGGIECNTNVCPANCYIEKNWCICQTNFNGGANYTVEINPWFFPAVPQFTGLIGQRNRYGHVMVSCGEDSLYVFGGFSLEKGLLKDLWVYNITSRKWREIRAITEDVPEGRYYHAAACVPTLRQIYIFGGIIRDRKNKDKYTLTKEMWRFAIGGRKWRRMDMPTEIKPIAGHTMTQIANTKLLIIGGFSNENYFSDKVFEYDVNEEFKYAWKEYKQTGFIPLGLYGHTAIHHSSTNSMYVYGGMLYNINRFYVSDELFVLNLDNDEKQWNVLQAENGSQKDTRYMHTAVDMGDYMVVLGGRTHRGNFSDSILVYRYLCNYWHMFHVGDTGFSMPLHSVFSPSAAVMNKSIYMMGGLDNLVHSEVIKFDLPSDVCSLIGVHDLCVKSKGCSACTILPQNKTYCYSNDRETPDICNEPDVRLSQGIQCSLQWHQERNCGEFKKCSHCLAVFPHFREYKQTCQWCANCPTEICIPVSKDCKTACNDSVAALAVKTNSGECHDWRCIASDCNKCNNNALCLWSQNNKRKDDGHIVVADQPTFRWGCFYDSPQSGHQDSSPKPQTCPKKCYRHTTCTSCLKSSGADGGSKECIWSDMLQECMSPAYRLLHCSGGECGLIIEGNHNKCPRSCTTNKWCSDCLAAPSCGWCAIGGLNGRGVCLRGGVKKPTNGSCDDKNGVNPGNGEVLSAEDRERIIRGLGSPQWVFTECLSENECENGHHNCDEDRENCIDTPEGFRCECKEGYLWEKAKGMCEPYCHQKCKHGFCELPDHCTCDFGYVGHDCSVQCECNGHSNCESAQNTTHCLKCVNFTQGDQCQECQVLYVGDPKSGKPCVSCWEHCHNHTHLCVSLSAFYNASSRKKDNKLFHSDVDIARSYAPRGPTFKDATCLECGHNTQGVKCESCVEGTFRVEKDDRDRKFDRCEPCQCHGHSNICDPKSGLNCRCANNTESPCPSSKDKDNSEKCWQKQCSACEEYFLGTPTKGHHCYRQMTVDRDYCFDPITQNNCNQNAHALHKGRTVYFAVQPRYLNVDIRVTIDVTVGGVDIYFSSSDQTFTTKVDHKGFHHIELDNSLYPSLHTTPTTDRYPYRQQRSVRHNSTSGDRHELIITKANDFHTYHTVKLTNTILVIENVQSRVVITLPLELGLRTSKFYIIMFGKGSKTSNDSYGNLYFRQDQTHIDLFVFFSVFFSSFFLFLAMCVLLWKLKQAVDAQRSRRERAAEMMHMASRPFARVLVLVEPDPMPFASTPIPRRSKHLKLIRTNQSGMPLPPVETLQINPRYYVKEETPFEIFPMATEPTEDGMASIRTIMFQLPGGPIAPTKLCLGSCLTLSSRAAMLGTKLANRRRPSSSMY